MRRFRLWRRVRRRRRIVIRPDDSGILDNSTYLRGWSLGSRTAHTPDPINARLVPVSGSQISQNTELVGVLWAHASRECTTLHNIS